MITDWDKLSEEDKFREIYWEHITRDGAGKLLEHLEAAGFFQAPASTKYHGAYPGGLVEHSNNVYRRLVMLNVEEGRRGRRAYPEETIAITALLHDVCKANAYYKQITPMGQQYAYNENDAPLGHGEKSVMIIMQSMELEPMEMLAIRWHMGAYDAAARYDLRELNRAFRHCKLVPMLHLADMMATHLDEREGIA